MQTLRLPAELASLEKFRAFVGGQALAAGLPESQLPRVELVLEELVTNLVRHAYKRSTGDIEITCGDGATGFQLRIADWGPAFNPLERPSPDLGASVEDRPIGGLGIHLVRNMTDTLDYRREKDRNIVTAVFRKPA